MDKLDRAYSNGAPRTTAEPCVLHTYHQPDPAYNHLHHVLPKGWGGSPNGQTISICPHGHTNIHAMLTEYRRLGATPEWEFLRNFGPKEREWAAEGWRRMTQLELPGMENL
jgi:hypothetical protein